MFCACLLALCLSPSGNPANREPLRYVRPAGGKFVLESEITYEKTGQGVRYVSVTHRSNVKMKLTIHLNKKNELASAETMLETKNGKSRAKAVFQGKSVRIETKGKGPTDIAFDTPPVIVTTAPDWSDILFSMRRYDFKKGGRQEFAGLWFHPSQKALKLAFVVEPDGHDFIVVKDKKLNLGRYRVRLRSGLYRVWADDNGRVYKLFHSNNPRSSVVLEGFESATKNLVN